MQLTEKQITFFKVFGFLKLPGLFADDVNTLIDQFHEVFHEYEKDVIHWVHATHENRLRRSITDATQRNAYFASLLDDSRIQEVATSLLGSGYEFRGSDASIYDCGTVFHQDGIDMGKPNSSNIKMALYLDEVDESSGAIRIIPGSHHRGDKYFGLLFKNWVGPDVLDLATAEYPSTIVPSSPGDLLLWDYRVMHGTVYGGNQRRMVAFEFSQGDAAESRQVVAAA